MGRPSWPSWAQTIRFRLATTSALVVLALGGLLIGGINAALCLSVGEAEPLRPVTVTRVDQQPGGQYAVRPGEPFEAADLSSVQQAVRYHVLTKLRSYSAYGLGGLAVLTLFASWWLSGRALRPMRRITSTARDVSASGLSARISLDGPRDEVRALAETIDQMLDRLEDSFRSQRNLIDDVSHELRNPLAVIHANLDAVLTLDDLTPQERAQANRVITRATERMIDLVENTLAKARVAAEAFDETELDLRTVAREAYTDYTRLATERDIQLRIEEHGPAKVIGDQAALRRAMDNLLSNAMRVAPEKTPVVLASGMHEGWAFLAVHDHGPGIPHGLPVFDRFVRAQHIHTDAGEPGTGLGLAIVRQIAEAHHGHAVAHSTPGHGATFVLWLPRLSDEHPTLGAAPPADNPLNGKQLPDRSP